MDINLLKQMKEIISKLPLEQQAEEYEKLVGTIISSMEEKKKVGRPKKDKVNTTPKTKKEEKSPDPEIDECIEMIKEETWVVDGTIKEQRQYSHLLINKIKKMGTGEWRQILKAIILCNKDSQYYWGWVSSPKKIYYNLGTLVSKIKTTIQQQDVSNYTLPWVI